MQALIISGGHLDDDFAAAYMETHRFDLVIAADAGIGFFVRNGGMPDYIVGDFDSAAPGSLEPFSQPKEMAEPAIQAEESGGSPLYTQESMPVILKFQPEKDETDTELAIRTAIGQGCDAIHLLGATGTRLDHVLGNVHLLGMAMEQGVSCIMVDPHNRIRMVDRELVLERKEQYGDYVSLLPFTPIVRGLTLKGLKYPLEDADLECYHSLGVSNEIVAEQAEIRFREGALLVVESKD